MTSMDGESVQGFRLSLQQRRLWRLQQQLGASSFRTQVSVGIAGDLSVPALQRALQGTLDRYEILRTVFLLPEHVRVPVQMILPRSRIRFDVHDLRDSCEEEQGAWVESLLVAMGDELLDLGNGPLIAGHLVRLADDRHRLLLQIPALCADKASVDVVLRDVAVRYRGEAAGAPTSSSEQEPLQYADLSQWQFEMLDEDQAESPDSVRAGRDFWHSADATALVTPGRYLEIGPGCGGFRARHVEVVPDARVGASLRSLADREGVSTASCFLAAWQVLHSRLGHETQGVTGVMCDGRTYEELDGAVGPLSKFLPVEHRIEPMQTFSSVVANCHSALAEAYDWQEYYDYDRFEGAIPGYFPVCFDFMEHRGMAPEGDPVFTLESQAGCLERYEIGLSVRQSGQEVLLQLGFDEDRFQRPIVERLLAQYVTLLESAVAESSRPIAELKLLPDEQRRQLLVDFNQTMAPESEECIHHLIERQSRRTPEAVAIRFRDETLTYRELDRRAGLLADHLRAEGVRADDVVGIHLECVPDFVVSMLAVLKAGGAYLALDPEYPSHRLELMLSNSRASLLLTSSDGAARLSHRGTTIDPRRYVSRAPARHGAAPAHEVSPDDRAYVMYTSGSTGQPKGVPVTHRNLVHSTCARMRYYGEPVERFLLLSSHSFDSSVVGLFWPLCTGGTLILPEPGSRNDARAIARTIEASKVTHMLCLPSLYGYILGETGRHDLGSLATVIVAGEACPRSLAEWHASVLSGTGMFNEYGPTEGTVWSSVFDCSTPDTADPLPIGKPVTGTVLYILDDGLEPVPIGARGELYLGGSGLSAGYLDAPALTAEKYVENPFGAGRLYRTGDLARYRSDGSVEFMGRVDDQIKLRGHRIELGEIEAVLRLQPGIREAVVVARVTGSITSGREEPADDPRALVDLIQALGAGEAESLLSVVEAMDEARVTARLRS